MGGQTPRGGLRPSRMRLYTLLLSSALLVFGANRVPDVPMTAVIETIEFKDIPASEQKSVLDRIQVRVGDVLSSEVRQRIGPRLQKGMTFSYRPGSRPQTAVLILNAGC
jgi:outer membrane protein assembly factor BamA